MEDQIAREQSDREKIQQLEFDYLAFRRERSVRTQGRVLLYWGPGMGSSQYRHISAGNWSVQQELANQFYVPVESLRVWMSYDRWMKPYASEMHFSLHGTYSPSQQQFTIYTLAQDTVVAPGN